MLPVPADPAHEPDTAPLTEEDQRVTAGPPRDVRHALREAPTPQAACPEAARAGPEIDHHDLRGRRKTGGAPRAVAGNRDLGRVRREGEPAVHYELGEGAAFDEGQPGDPPLAGEVERIQPGLHRSAAGRGPGVGRNKFMAA